MANNFGEIIVDAEDKLFYIQVMVFGLKKKVFDSLAMIQSIA